MLYFFQVRKITKGNTIRFILVFIFVTWTLSSALYEMYVYSNYSDNYGEMLLIERDRSIEVDWIPIKKFDKYDEFLFNRYYLEAVQQKLKKEYKEALISFHKAEQYSDGKNVNINSGIAKCYFLLAKIGQKNYKYNLIKSRMYAMKVLKKEPDNVTSIKLLQLIKIK